MRNASRIAVLLLIIFSGCRRAIPDQGTWNGRLELAEGTIVPFRMNLDLRSPAPAGSFIVGDEQIPIPEISWNGDSLMFRFSEYGAEMRGDWNGSRWSGSYLR